MKENDVLVCQWGATMVLYDFYKVLGFSSSGKSVFLKQISVEHLPGGELWKDPVLPQPDIEIGPVLTRKIKDDAIKISPNKIILIKDIWDGQQVFYENHLD
jgi:hypothetical protein